MLNGGSLYSSDNCSFRENASFFQDVISSVISFNVVCTRFDDETSFARASFAEANSAFNESNFKCFPISVFRNLL